MRDAFVSRLMVLAERDPRIVLITGDLGFGVLTRFAASFPKQFLNAGVAEQNMTGLATGLALEGRVVFTYSIANFPILRCLEQVRNDACYHSANVKIVAIGGGFSYGALGISHHATEDLSIMRSLPDITVVAPTDRWEAEEATEALLNTPGTCYLRLDKSAARTTALPDERFEIGRARVIRNGTDLAVICAGGIMEEAWSAAEHLETRGISLRLVSMHTIKPLDRGAVFAACRETGGILTVEEHTVDGGLGSAVAEVCLEAGVIPRRFARIGLRSGFSSIVGSQRYLRRRYGMDAAAIIRCVEELMAIKERDVSGISHL